MTEKCCDPNALVVQCMVCGAEVHTCEKEVADNGDYRCEAHGDGCQIPLAGWVCSEVCFDEYFSSK